MHFQGSNAYELHCNYTELTYFPRPTVATNSHLLYYYYLIELDSGSINCYVWPAYEENVSEVHNVLVEMKVQPRKKWRKTTSLRRAPEENQLIICPYDFSYTRIRPFHLSKNILLKSKFWVLQTNLMQYSSLRKSLYFKKTLLSTNICQMNLAAIVLRDLSWDASAMHVERL